jgi:hypothetical protein
MPVRVKTESGALVTLPDDFYDSKVHGAKVTDADESPLIDGAEFRPPTYPKSSAKSAASSKES